MRFGLQILFLVLGLPLQALVIATLVRGPWRRYPLLLAFSAVDFVSTLVQAPGALQSMLDMHPTGLPYWITYWTGEVINELLVYAVVISLLYRACERLRSAQLARLCLILGACLIAGGTFLLHYEPSLKRGEWLTPWFRDLSFACALMDIVLWTSLLVARDKDRQLMMLSGGMGVQFAGVSIGESLRQIAMKSHSHQLALAGGVITVAGSLFRMFIWWHALRETRPKQKAPPQLETARIRG